MANFLDLAMPIVEKDSKGDFVATPYFEDYLFQIISAIGGEGAELDINSPSLVTSLLSKIAKLEKTVEDLSQIKPVSINLTEVRSRINNLEQLAPVSLKGELSKINKRIDDFEQLVSPTFTSKGFQGAPSSTDNAIARWDGTGGKRLLNSGITIDDNNKMLFPLDNDAADPTIKFGDGDSGFYEESDDVMALSLGGVKRYSFSTTKFTMPTGFWDNVGISLNAGDNFKIGGITVLKDTTLGAGVLASSLTSVGTLTVLDVTGIVSTLAHFSVDGIQVVSNRGAAIANPAATLASLQTAVVAILDRMRPAGHGLIGL